MDIYAVIIGASFILQTASVFLAVRLLLLPGGRTAGLLALTVFSLMAFQRGVSVLQLVRGGITGLDHLAEIIAFIVSLLLFIGVRYVTVLVTSEKRMASSLKESQRRYQTLFEQSPDGIVLVDTAGNIIEFNETAHRDLGYTREEFAKLRLSDIDPVETAEEIRKSIEDTLRKGKAEFEVRHRTKDGEMRDVEVLTRVMRLSGRPVFHTIWRDVTQRKLAETASRENEKFLQTIIDTEPECIKLLAADGTLLLMNRAGLAMIDADSLEQVRGQCIYPLVAPEYRETFTSLTEDVFRGKAGVLEFDAVGLKGRRITLETHAVPLRGGKDEIIALLGVTRDVTDRKKAEEALRESENRYRLLFDQSPDGILLIDEAGGIVEFNDSAHRRLGYSREEFARLRVADVDVFESPDEVRARIRDIFREGRAEFEVKHKTKQGELRDVHVMIQAIHLSGGPILHAIWHDITGRKRAEEARIRSERRFHALFDSTPLGVVMVGTDRAILDCNAAFQKMLGYSLDELKALSVPAISHPGDDLATRDYYREMLEGKRDSFTMEKRHIRKDGSTLWTNLTGTVVRDEQDGPQLLFGIVEDISGRKKMEEDLRNSRDFIERILDTVDEAFIVIDRDYKIVMANSAYGDQVGIPVDQIVGKRCHEISHQSEIPCFEAGEDCSVRHCFETGEPHSCVHKHMNKDGSVLYVETKAFPLKDASGNVTSAIEVINNITDKHLLEEQILRTQKLEAVGLLAGGIAHDFNNLLQGLFGSISMAKMFSDNGGKAYEMLERAERVLSQATNLTKQLLTFSKGGEPVKKAVALPSVVENSAKFALSGSNVEFRFSVDKDLRPVEADEGQISQVIHNIVLNASEAMPEGGTVSLEMRNVDVDDKSGLPLKKGNYVRIDITDSGQGIPEQYHSRIFDPYFTTKQRGSGLGLATSYSILKKHGGVVTVRSQVGAGSTFSVYLPASGRVLAPAKVEPGDLLAGRGRILVLDDEEVVRTIATHMLESLGYEVVTVENGERAVEKYSEAMASKRPFGVVILDLTVRGGMGGRETLAKLLDLDPAVRAVVSSGYSGDAVLSHYKEHGFRAVLSKPYKIEDLGRLLNDLLSAENPDKA
jgi:PAS domain S-box-containing protein